MEESDLRFMQPAKRTLMKRIAIPLTALAGAFVGGIFPGSYMGLGIALALCHVFGLGGLPALFTIWIAFNVFASVALTFFGLFLGKALFEVGIANTEKVARIQFDEFERLNAILVGIISGLVGFFWLVQQGIDL